MYIRRQLQNPTNFHIGATALAYCNADSAASVYDLNPTPLAMAGFAGASLSQLPIPSVSTAPFFSNGYNVPAQYRKLFIGGLSHDTSDDQLRQYYSKWGQVVDCIVIRDPMTRHSRGFGFVTYASSHMADIAMQERPHTINGKVVDPKRAIPRELMQTSNPVHVFLDNDLPMECKLSLSGLHWDHHTVDDLREYFEKFGPVEQVEIVGQPRGYGFIVYEDRKGIEKCVAQGRTHIISGKKVDIKEFIQDIPTHFIPSPINVPSDGLTSPFPTALLTPFPHQGYISPPTLAVKKANNNSSTPSGGDTSHSSIDWQYLEEALARSSMKGCVGEDGGIFPNHPSNEEKIANGNQKNIKEKNILTEKTNGSVSLPPSDKKEIASSKEKLASSNKTRDKGRSPKKAAKTFNSPPIKDNIKNASCYSQLDNQYWDKNRLKIIRHN